MRKHMLGGRVFGRLLVLAPSFVQSGWVTGCECGEVLVVKANAMLAGRQVSCGCWKNEQAVRNAKASGPKAGATRTRHGRAKDGVRDRAYSTWEGMIARCTNPKTINYRWYGAKGVTVCERWRDFANFLADMGEPPPSLTLDRINPFGNYEPGNCRWATHAEQARNKRSAHAQ